MKTLTAITLVILCSSIMFGCTKNDIRDDAGLQQPKCLKGILVKKGICGERVIRITSESKAGVSYASQWKDESGKSYEDVFAVENFCSFPASISEGTEFNFKLTAATKNDCVRCAAITPVPTEKNSIEISTDCATDEK
jgi:hypothetical protein